MNNVKSGPCVVCGHRSEDLSESFEILFFNCPRCGLFRITYEAKEFVENLSEKHLISGFIREEHVRRRKPFIKKSDLAQIISTAPREVLELMDRLLLNLQAMMIPKIGPVAIAPGEDYSLGYCENEEVFNYIIEMLRADGFVKSSTSPSYNLTVTPNGWRRIREISTENRMTSKQAFVAMAAAEEYNQIYLEGIEPAIRATGFDPYLAKAHKDPRMIDNRILREIRKSRFLIADVTGHRQSVYFEAGYALSLGLVVFWTCDKKDKKNCAFDTRQFYHVFWQNTDELKADLIDFIGANIH
ncbi:MAG: hypothetical protein IH914_04155 [candidate division Zixibacteria bacterium]|nr:hypothetical protein [candidate division Zixibacteria bacterium]